MAMKRRSMIERRSAFLSALQVFETVVRRAERAAMTKAEGHPDVLEARKQCARQQLALVRHFNTAVRAAAPKRSRGPYNTRGA